MLVAEQQISEPTFGIYITPLGANGTAEGTGEITFGGVDTLRIQGKLVHSFFFCKFVFLFGSSVCRPIDLGSPKCTRGLPLGI
jgi:hypothetical protein